MRALTKPERQALSYVSEVLPAVRLDQLREACNYVKYRERVYGEWGFDLKLSGGKGLSVLFAGPSGTGKTMAAEIIAGELGLDLYKIDLKGFQDRNYRKLGGVLQNVLDTIQQVHGMGFWLEIVTLIIPGFNDSPEELRDIARVTGSYVGENREFARQFLSVDRARVVYLDPLPAGRLPKAGRVGVADRPIVDDKALAVDYGEAFVTDAGHLIRSKAGNGGVEEAQVSGYADPRRSRGGQAWKPARASAYNPAAASRWQALRVGLGSGGSGPKSPGA